MSSRIQEYCDEGNNFLNSENYEQAIKSFKKALDLDPDNSYLLGDIGYAYLMMDDCNKAENYLKRALENNAKNILSLLDYGFLFQKKNNLIKAQECYEKALDIDPDLEYALKLIGDLYLIQEKYDLAIKYYDKYLKLDNKDAHMLTSKSLALTNLGKTSEALEVVDEAIKLDSNIYMSWIIKSIIAFRLKNFDEVIKYAKKVLKLEQNSCWAFFQIRSALKLQGHIKKAKEYEKKILETDCIIFEKQLEKNLISNLDLLNKFGFKLKLLKSQYSCKNPSGNNRYIDILCKDIEKDSYTIIELKIVEANIDTYNQIKEYIDVIKTEKNTENVNGIVISFGFNQEFENKLKEDDSLIQINTEDLGFEVY